MAVNDFGVILRSISSGLLQGFGIQLIPEMIQDLTRKQACFVFGIFPHQQTIFFRQRKTGTLRGLSVNFKQSGRSAGSSHDADITNFKANQTHLNPNPDKPASGS